MNSACFFLKKTLKQNKVQIEIKYDLNFTNKLVNFSSKNGDLSEL